MIETINLSKRFRKNEISIQGKKKVSRNADFFAVDNISIKANDGEILGIIGPNGAGKTTLLRMMGGIMEPTSGQVVVYDKDGNAISDKTLMKKHIGYLSGNTKLYNRFSTREILNFAGEIYGLDKETINKRIDEIIEILNLSQFVDNRIGNLSTGQTQRANIARTIIHNPDIYILDEPTLGLDILSSEAIIDFMKYEKEHGTTVLYSTHYMEEAQYLCDRVVMVHGGHVIKEGTPESVMMDTNKNNLREAFRFVMSSSEDSITVSDCDLEPIIMDENESKTADENSIKESEGIDE